MGPRQQWMTKMTSDLVLDTAGEGVSMEISRVLTTNSYGYIHHELGVNQ